MAAQRTPLLHTLLIRRKTHTTCNFINAYTHTHTGSGRTVKSRRSARNRTKVVDAIKHFHSARVIISADKGWRLRAPDSSVRMTRCLYTRIAPRG